VAPPFVWQAASMVRDDQLRQAIHMRLRDFPLHESSGLASGRQAAVAITVVDTGHGADLPGLPNSPVWSNAAALLLTRRSQSLRNHPGQWAFPGGRLDAGETVIECALRELNEEVGLSLPTNSVLGQLDDFVTRSGFVITPVVVWAGETRSLAPNPDEVASVHRIPLTEFVRGDAPMLEASPHSEHPVLRMPVGEDHIAAPTAALIYQFREVCLLDRLTRVAHFEQPEFAWR